MRRLRSASVRTLLDTLEQRVVAPRQPDLFWMIDGKPLAISGCSKDRQAGYGRAANCKAKGYKIHAIVDPEGAIAAWRVAPMNKDERVMAARLVRTAPIQGYLVGDSNYDSNPLHEACGRRDQLYLVTRRRHQGKHGLGHHKQTAGRLHSVQLENPYPRQPATAQHRGDIERLRPLDQLGWAARPAYHLGFELTASTAGSKPNQVLTASKRTPWEQGLTPRDARSW